MEKENAGCFYTLRMVALFLELTHLALLVIVGVGGPLLAHKPNCPGKKHCAWSLRSSYVSHPYWEIYAELGSPGPLEGTDLFRPVVVALCSASVYRELCLPYFLHWLAIHGSLQCSAKGCGSGMEFCINHLFSYCPRGQDSPRMGL